MKAKGSFLMTAFRLFEILTVAFIIGITWFPQYNWIYNPFLGISIFLYSVFACYYIILTAATAIMMSKVANALEDHPNYPDYIKVLNEFIKKKTLFKKIIGIANGIFLYAIRVAVIILFAYTDHNTLSSFSVLILFNLILVFIFTRRFYKNKKEESQKNEETKNEVKN